MSAKQWFTLPTVTPSDDARGQQPEAEKDLAAALDTAIRAIEESASEKTRRDNLIYDLELYYGCRIGSLYDIQVRGYDAQDWQPENLQYNIVYALCSTVQNRICSFRPRADFVPSSGDYKLRSRAKDMRAGCDAWMQEDHIYEERDFMVRDILTSDAGVIKIYDDGEEHITASRFPSWEFLVAEKDGRNRRPWCMFHVRWIPLDEALAKYAPDEGDDPSQLDQALRMGALDAGGMSAGIAYGLGVQMVREVDAYKRANSKGEDGRRVIMCGRKIALDKPWKHPEFPVVIKRFDKRSIGFWGISGIHTVRGLQTALNDEMMAIQAAHENASLLVVQHQEGSSAPKVNNAFMRVESYTTQPNIYTTPPPVHQERYRYIEEMRKIAYEVWGVSQFIAAGTKQPGVTSKVAIREVSELQSDRLALLSQMNEEIIVEVADWWRKLNEDLGQRATWRVMDRGMIRKVTFAPMGDDVFVRVLPTSLFGQSVAGRVDKAMEYVDKEWLSREDAMRAVDVPDLAPIIDLELSEPYYMEGIVDEILEQGIYETPSEYLDPAKMVAYAKKRYFAAVRSGVDWPAGHIGLLCKLIDAEMKRASSQAPAQAAAPPAGAPPAGPAPMPTPGAPAPMPAPAAGPPPPAMA
jgi:hypothetical protein